MYNNRATSYLTLPRADNTIRAYLSDWQDFQAWCKKNKVKYLPATAETVGNYISDLADVVCANTVARHLTAISSFHIQLGWGSDNPAKNWEVRRIMANIKRSHGTHQHGKAAITPALLRQMLPLFNDSLQSIRDKAIILLGFAGALRRSEIAALQVGDVNFSGAGMLVTIEKSKTDKYGQGQTIAIPTAATTDLCPVQAVKNWLQAANIKNGFLFRALWKGYRVKRDKMCDKAIALIVKEYCAKIGLDASEYSGHSLRRGFATAAAAANVSSFDIMRQTRHKSESMVNRYIAEGKAFENHPLSKIL